MPLYQIHSNSEVVQLKPSTFSSERELQRLFEANLLRLLGVRFIATEFFTGDRQKGRIDTLGLDQDGSPTIIEYKKSKKEDVINQGLFYLDWLVDHKGDFTIAAQGAFGGDVHIDWSQPRLVLVAESFSKYDKYAVNRIGSNIELWTYHRYGDDLLFLDPLFVTNPRKQEEDTGAAGEIPQPLYSVEDHLKGKNENVQALFAALQEGVFALAEEGEIAEKPNKMYIGYKHGKNFCEVKLQANGIKLWLDILYDDLSDPHGLGRDVVGVGHHGTGDVEVKLNSLDDIEKVLALIEQAYIQTV